MTLVKNNKIIPFNKPYLTGKELHYIYQAVNYGKLSGNGIFTQKCQSFFEQKYGFKKCLLTTSCTDALEMAAILADIKKGDEVIMPSYTFVSTALAFVRQGAKIVYVDSYPNNPNLDADELEALVTEKTRVIVPVHYAGVSCDMDKIMSLADKYNLLVIEDAAQAINSYYISPGTNIKKPLGSMGHIAAFSFHETKNIISGEGGMLAINDERFSQRAEIIWEKGTNRADFFRGEVNKYGWVDVGSSFLPSEIIAAFLYAQIEQLDSIQEKRKMLWDEYYRLLEPIAKEKQLTLPNIPSYATNNAHMFYLICNDLSERTNLIARLKEHNILAVFHYLGLHNSQFHTKRQEIYSSLSNCQKFTDCLVRLPLFYELEKDDIERIVSLL